MDRGFFYTIANARHYERVDAFPQQRFAPVVQSHLGDDWTCERQQMWLMCKPRDLCVADHGFKLHVSSTHVDAESSLARVIPIVVQLRAAFKLVADPALLMMLNGKRAPRQSSGKFITIYPSDRKQFYELGDALAEALADGEGPYILSDRRYKNCRALFYRYGEFVGRRELTIGGMRRAMMDFGERAVEDLRQPFFSLPADIEDPFPAPEPHTGPIILAGRFEMIQALSDSNAGGVYLSIDRHTGDRVVVKEARPLTGLWTKHDRTSDAVGRLRSEFAILERLAGTSHTPRPLALFEEWEHLFLAQTMCPGAPVTTFRALPENAVIRILDKPSKVSEFERRFMAIAESLIDAVDAVHKRDVIIGDLSPGNVLVDSNLRVSLVDFESATTTEATASEQRFAAIWRTPGFKSTSADALANDYYAAGMVLYSLVLPVQELFVVHPAAATSILARLEAAGLPQSIVARIESLIGPRTEQTSRVAP